MKGREAYPDEELRRRIMDFIMVAGQTLLENGAEVFRVEQTMEIMARSFHLREFHVYVLTNGIFASAVWRPPSASPSPRTGCSWSAAWAARSALP